MPDLKSELKCSRIQYLLHKIDLAQKKVERKWIKNHSIPNSYFNMHRMKIDYLVNKLKWLIHVY